MAPQHQRCRDAPLALIVFPAYSQRVCHAMVPEQRRVVIKAHDGASPHGKAVVLELPLAVKDGGDVPQLRIDVDLDHVDAPDTAEALSEAVALLARERGTLVDDDPLGQLGRRIEIQMPDRLSEPTGVV